MIEVLKRYPRGVFTAMGLRFGENIIYYMIVTFSITYLHHRAIEATRILALLFAAHILHVIVIPLVGLLADRWGRRPVYIVGAALSMAWPFFAFPMFDTGGTAMILGAIMLGLAIHAFMYAPQPAIMAEMFPTRMRYSGVSLGYQATAIVAGSWAPLIGTALLRQYDSWVPIAFYILFAGAISLIAAFSLRESKGLSLRTIDAEDMRRLTAASPM